MVESFLDQYLESECFYYVPGHKDIPKYFKELVDYD